MNIEFQNLITFIILSFFLSTILIFISILFSENKPYKNKITVYECGFNPFHNPGEPLSIKFFLVAMIFLIFDLEITLLFPWCCYSSYMNYFSQLIILIFIILLVIGLIYEWYKGGLEWE